MTRARAVLLAAAVAAVPARAAELVPVGDAQVLMGQLFENGKASSWQGNAALNVTPAVKFSDAFGLIPTYSFAYRGTKSVTDLGSGGQLFQDSMTHALRAKGVWKRGDLKLKPQVGYRVELMRETRDESWGKGLFDYRKPSAGLEAEYAFGERGTATAGFDWYLIRFPNYRSLESSVQGQGLGREQAEARTLDSSNLAWTLGGSFPTAIPDVKGRLNLGLTRRSFGQQHIVRASGLLTGETRRDTIKSVTGGLFWGKRVREDFGVFLSLDGGWSRVDSNQNHFDAETSVFTSNFYSYEERTVAPRAAVIAGRRRVELGVSYQRVDRLYLSRRAQDEAGAVTPDAWEIAQDNFVFDLGVPLNKRWKLIAVSSIATARSNQRYQKFFRTNYTLQSHMLGVSFTY